MIRPGFRVAALMYAFIAVAATLSPRDARAELSVTPITWNIVGLDSNSPATGPRRFPVGARVCSDVATSDVLVQFEW